MDRQGAEPYYIPSAEDKPLFNLKNHYWYKAIVDIIQELSLRAIVNAGPVGDGQTVWTNIVTAAEKSTTARISLQSLTAYLTTFLRFKMALGGVQTLRILTTGMNRCTSLWNICRRHL
jgi:hypothetical protein